MRNFSQTVMPIDNTELTTVALVLITSELFDMWQPKSEFANFRRNFAKKPSIRPVIFETGKNSNCNLATSNLALTFGYFAIRNSARFQVNFSKDRK